MKKCEMTQQRTLRLHPGAACNATFIVAMLLAGPVSAQGWPFTDAPEPVGFGILQTANQSAVGQPDHSGNGVIMSAESLDLGPGETVVGGDPILRQSGIIRQPGGGVSSGATHGIPYLPLNQSGHGANRRPRGKTRFGPSDCYDCSWGCPEGCAPACYGSFEGLYFKQGNMDAVNYSRNLFGLVGDDYEPGIRVTLGRMLNCSDGFEATFTGLLEWEYGGFRSDPTSQLNFRPVPPGALTEADLPGLYDTSLQTQRFKARYNSAEFNHRQWGWDVISTVAGVRVISYEEQFDFNSNNTTGDSGHFSQDIDNVMVGAQLGLDLMYPVMKRLMVGSRIRGGLYANFVDGDTSVSESTNPQQVMRDSFDDTDYAGLFEYGISADYHFTRYLSAKIGYEFWYMMHVNTVAANFPSAYVTGETDDLGFHGATASIEALF
ncbi:hypothetical protein EC9_07490 [Rosistilla ulvae]|uniref:Uncharacterized protein n=1 Tax=Rosistilla ulvae TaxID=1930277 RepID=A0A517LVE0_9BACT|nr:hypothetical protein [Rosistilla ulvae]QDS86582.1 hypothetical protein EC9_07490 [Rosistilla ulvae]